MFTFQINQNSIDLEKGIIPFFLYEKRKKYKIILEYIFLDLNHLIIHNKLCL